MIHDGSRGDHAIVDSRIDFAFRLSAALLRNKATESVCCSPASIFDALVMVYLGAVGNTRAELARVLGLGDLSAALSDVQIRDAIHALHRNRSAVGDGITLAEAAALFVDHALSLSPALRQHAELATAEIVTAPMLANEGGDIVNRWVKDKTHGRIPSIVASGPVGYFTVATAIHFAGRWQDPFLPGDTKDHIFRRPDGETLCRMMWTAGERVYTRPLRLLDDPLCQGARIPYRGERLAFYALKPAAGKSLEALCAALDARTFRRLRGNFVEHSVPVGLPRIQADCALDLGQPLFALGIADLFSPGRRDLSGIGSAPDVPNLYVDKVLHRASIEVDESGTVASAATVISTRAGGISRPMVFDRPFLLIISDEQSDDILFMGAIQSPHGGPPRQIPESLLRERELMRKMPWHRED